MPFLFWGFCGLGSRLSDVGGYKLRVYGVEGFRFGWGQDILY